VAWSAILPVALAQLTILIATANGYGYHRDELYFIEAAKHPAFGYDDQPPLTPLIGRLSQALFGSDPRGLRVFSALAMAIVVVLVSLIAAELGAARTGQFVVAVGAALSIALFVGHILSTTTFDLFFWVLIAYLVTRVLGGGDQRLWLLVGLVAGIALESKNLVLLLIASLAVGFALDRRLDPPRSRWLWAGAAIAIALWLPNLLWQAQHGWPQLELGRKIGEEDPIGYRALLVPFQFLLGPPPLCAVWIAGVRRLVRGQEARAFRPLGYAYVALLAISFVLGAKPYYTGGLLLVVLAAGGAPVERWVARHARARLLLLPAVVLSVAVSVFLALPVTPVESVHATPISDINEDAIETIGWPRFVETVAKVRDAVPEPARGNLVIFAGNYGEAGAVDRFGPALGLPSAYSGHNSYARWRVPPGSAGPVIVLGYGPQGVKEDFKDCVESARIDNGVDLDNEEQDGQVWTCSGPIRPWAEVWPQLRHLSP
jgi:4-amino-4-deoxy-L-arabinose transferase-like glycosyltransferase